MTVETVLELEINSYDGTRLVLDSRKPRVLGTRTVSYFGQITVTGSDGVVRQGWGLVRVQPYGALILKGDDVFGGSVEQARWTVNVTVVAGKVVDRTEDLEVNSRPLDGSESDVTTRTFTTFDGAVRRRHADDGREELGD